MISCSVLSVAVALALSDGLIVGVDSAVTISFGPGKTNIYESAEKLFQLGSKRIGVATLGMASIGDRSIGSFIREFESRDPEGVMTRDAQLSEVAEALRTFMYEKYAAVIIPALEAQEGIPFGQIPISKRPSLGLIIGGYSSGEFLPEVWKISIPEADAVATSQVLQERGFFGLTWHAVSKPIQRYINGIDDQLLLELETAFTKILGRSLAANEIQDFKAIISRHQYHFVYGSMPISAGVQFVRFLVTMVIEHYKVVAEDSIVGGQARIGVVTYKGSGFELLG